MIEYIIPTNPDDRILNKASQILRDGGLCCLMTDTNWTVLADPFTSTGVEKLYRLRSVDPSKHFTVFCADLSQASQVAWIDDAAFRLVKKLIPGAYTFIFKAQKRITRYLKASRTDHQVGVRFPSQKLVKQLLKTHGDVLIGGHITHEQFPQLDDSIPLYSALIEDEMGHQIELILDSGEEQEFSGQTSIIDLSSEEGPTVLRHGAGDISLLGF